ncbi:hypothetical protein ACLQ3K_24815 [Tsukamurella sp. DT100]|uniref:hypothetical protein n=1 Tax=Tsukamurella sp. DT100 TaxID=3393415 RepID=UPI003CF8D8F7
MMNSLTTTVMVAYVPMPDTMRKPIELMLGWGNWIFYALLVALLMAIGGFWWLEPASKSMPLGIPAQERLIKVLAAAVLISSASPIADAIIK